MNAHSLHQLTKKVSDWKILIGVGAIVLTTIFNLGSSLFNYALITKLEPINKKVSAIEESGKLVGKGGTGVVIIRYLTSDAIPSGGNFVPFF